CRRVHLRARRGPALPDPGSGPSRRPLATCGLAPPRSPTALLPARALRPAVVRGGDGVSVHSALLRAPVRPRSRRARSGLLRFRVVPGAPRVRCRLGGALGGAATFGVPLVVARLAPPPAAVLIQGLALPAAILLAVTPNVGVAIVAAYVRGALRGMADPIYS